MTNTPQFDGRARRSDAAPPPATDAKHLVYLVEAPDTSLTLLTLDQFHVKLGLAEPLQAAQGSEK